MAMIGILALLAALAAAVISFGWRVHLFTNDPEEYRRLRELEREYKEGRNMAIANAVRRLFQKGDDDHDPLARGGERYPGGAAGGDGSRRGAPFTESR